MADEVIRRLESIGFLPKAKGEERRKKLAALPFPLFMEVAAAMRLNAWQDDGLCDLLGKDEETAAFAALDKSEAAFLVRPATSPPGEGLPPLADKLLDIWRRRLAWNAFEDLGVDLLLDASPADEEVVLKNMAGLLWEYRHAQQRETTRE